MDGMGVAGHDWLTVNVWSPDVSGDLPVMVWIQGGAYAVGMSGLPEYDGTRLASDGVVLVTFNYRVTIFGQSAGGGSVAALLAMPRAAGLFQRVIASSVPGTFFTPELAADIAAMCAAELGLRPTVEICPLWSPSCCRAPGTR